MSTQGEHTPGPWKVFWGKRKRHMFIGIGTEAGEGVTDPHFSLWRGDSEEAAANARLIAAAPDLLEALRALADAHYMTISSEGYDPTHSDCPVLNDAHAAISRATGRTENEQPDNSGAEKTICQPD